MDDYIKRKKKIDASKITNDTETTAGSTQTLGQIVVRQSNQQLQDLACKVQYIQQRIGKIKLTLRQTGVRTNSIFTKSNTLLGNTSMQKSSIKNQLPNGQTSNSDQIIQQSVVMEKPQRMAEERDVQSTRRQNVTSIDEKLQQPSKRIGGTRKIKKKF